MKKKNVQQHTYTKRKRAQNHYETPHTNSDLISASVSVTNDEPDTSSKRAVDTDAASARPALTSDPAASPPPPVIASFPGMAPGMAPGMGRVKDMRDGAAWERAGDAGWDARAATDAVGAGAGGRRGSWRPQAQRLMRRARTHSLCQVKQ